MTRMLAIVDCMTLCQHHTIRGGGEGAAQRCTIYGSPVSSSNPNVPHNSQKSLAVPSNLHSAKAVSPKSFSCGSRKLDLTAPSSRNLPSLRCYKNSSCGLARDDSHPYTIFVNVGIFEISDINHGES